MDDDDEEFGLHVGEPYLVRDWRGNFVVLQEETLFSTGKLGDIKGVHITETLVNPNPSDAEIFKYKLKGDIKQSTWNEPKPNKV